MSPHIRCFATLHRAVFLLNSPPSLFTATYKINHRHSLLRTYGINLQSSLTVINLLALEYSSCPRVFVLGTVMIMINLETFLGNLILVTSLLDKSFARTHNSCLIVSGFSYLQHLLFEQKSINLLTLTFFVIPSFII